MSSEISLFLHKLQNMGPAWGVWDWVFISHSELTLIPFILATISFLQNDKIWKTFPLMSFLSYQNLKLSFWVELSKSQFWPELANLGSRIEFINPLKYILDWDYTANQTQFIKSKKDKPSLFYRLFWILSSEISLFWHRLQNMGPAWGSGTEFAYPTMS